MSEHGSLHHREHEALDVEVEEAVLDASFKFRWQYSSNYQFPWKTTNMDQSVQR